MNIQNIFRDCPDVPDLTNSLHLEQIIDKVDQLLFTFRNIDELNGAEIELAEDSNLSTPFTLLSFKVAKSKLILRKYKENSKISVVFAMYKEHNRIKNKSQHQHGEDFLIRKISQLKWLFDDCPNFIWELIIVDDGCPEDSGKIALEIIENKNITDNVKVLFLKDAISKNLAITGGLTSTDESRKGGSILYGMWHAIQKSSDDNHIVVFSDADLSTHLGQIGLLLEPILIEKKNAAIGSRREANSVVVKKGARNNRGKLFIYLWKRMIPEISYIVDTQCGFKAFKKEILSIILDDLIERKFAFDIELLLKTELHNPDSIEKVAIAWIDSDEASTTTDLQPYLAMLKSVAKMYRKYLPENIISSSFASFIESLNENEFQQLLNNIPEEITGKDPAEFSSFDQVSVDDLKDRI